MSIRVWSGIVLGTAACGLGMTLLHSETVAAAGPAVIIPVPANYREWVYLTSGLDMTYAAVTGVPQPPNHDGQFDNVFAEPEAYAAFKRSGIWPEQTTLVLENRVAKANVSINKGGRTQAQEVIGVELHVKRDGHWAFYGFDPDGKEHLIPKPAGCYTCHEAHAAADTTFVQFYPTLLPIAEAKHTLSANYLAEPHE